ncbi:MAG: FkbM family methyltransferase [Pseudomonadota bacterium]
MTQITLRDAFGGGALPIIDAVDVGASPLDGAPRWRALSDAGLMRVWGFEPDDVQFARLQDSAPMGFTPIQAALGRGGPATLHIARYPGNTSLYAPDETLINLFTGIGAETASGNFAVVDQKPIETRRLDEFDIPPPAFIKLDVQGAELDVMDGAGAALDSVGVLETEALFVPLYKGQPLFGDIQRWFADRGFLLHKVVDLASRAYRPVSFGGSSGRAGSQWLWADAIFIRDPRSDAVWPPLGRLKAAMILHELYKSYDLAFALLRSHDDETGEHRATAYAHALKNTEGLAPWLTNIRHD